MTPLHEPECQRFTLPTTPVSVLDYELAPAAQPQRVVFTHTGVPPAWQGRGLAALLVEAGLTWARDQGFKVVPACSYVALFIERHPQWRELLVSL